MKRILKWLAANGDSLLLLAGCALTAVGAGMLSLPAGLIVGGVLAVAVAVLSIHGEDGDA